jgi:hypothetical protein
VPPWTIRVLVFPGRFSTKAMVRTMAESAGLV